VDSIDKESNAYNIFYTKKLFEDRDGSERTVLNGLCGG
jgi:hypothetical protein